MWSPIIPTKLMCKQSKRHRTINFFFYIHVNTKWVAAIQCQQNKEENARLHVIRKKLIIQELNMSIRYTFVVLKMLYRTKKKILENSFSIAKCDPKEKSGATLLTSTV